jgi:hypothetical protein
MGSNWYNDAICFRSDFSYVPWWIILIPSYFIVAKGVLWLISKKIKEKV